MKRVIEGMVYDTSTATAICELPCHHYRGDFQWHRTTLFRSPKGRYFLAGQGGPASMWATPVGNNGQSGGEGIRVLDDIEARDYAESAELSPEEMTAAGFSIVEG